MIRFFLKAALQRAVGALPGGAGLYRSLQRGVSRSIMADRDAVLQKRAVALDYIARLARHDLTVRGCRLHVEIGSGWIPTIPLVLHQHGLTRQTLTDIHGDMTLNQTLAAAAILEAAEPTAPRFTAVQPGDDLRRWLGHHGIDYRAPAQPPFDMPAGSADLVTCTQALMYPPRSAVAAIYAEAARLLRPGGVFIASLRLDDLYAGADPQLSRYNFLRYGDVTWQRWFNNRFTPLNRLRPSDHAALLAGLPFERLDWDIAKPGTEDLAALSRIPVHADFARYDRTDLAATAITMLMRRTA
jgi:SAM-dependent methyltransferase